MLQFTKEVFSKTDQPILRFTFAFLFFTVCFVFLAKMINIVLYHHLDKTIRYTIYKICVTIQLTQTLSSRPPIFPNPFGTGVENGACRDPGIKARAVIPGARRARFSTPYS